VSLAGNVQGGHVSSAGNVQGGSVLAAVEGVGKGVCEHVKTIMGKVGSVGAAGS